MYEDLHNDGEPSLLHEKYLQFNLAETDDILMVHKKIL